MGCRVGELINISIKDIILPKESHLKYADIELDGKTGKRTNTITEAYPYLIEWLEEHSLAGNDEAPLFINLSNRWYGRRFLYQGVVSILRTAARKAEIGGWGSVNKNGKKGYHHKWGKNITPHNIRHSRATYLAHKGWTEPELRIQFGWTKKSSMPSTYCHIGREEIKKKLLAEHGLQPDAMKLEEERQKAALKPKSCPMCLKEGLPATAVACNCGAVLTPHDRTRIKELAQDSRGFIEKLNQLPIRSNLIEDNMTQLEYKKKLVKNDPFLKEEFAKIAKEILLTQKRETELIESKQNFQNKGRETEINRPSPQADKYSDVVLNMRDKGLSMEKIAEFIGIGYGTVNKICKENGQSKTLQDVV
jgi:hypothetical protein